MKAIESESFRGSAWRRTTSVAPLIVFAVILAALFPRASAGDEHADHHPGGAAPAPAASSAGGGMGAMMAGMMPPSPSGGCMGGDCGSGAPKTPIYPSLMTLPALTPGKRAEIDALATQQVNEGMARLAKGSESLNVATRAGDNAAMQQSVGGMREGLDELEAGIAARRVLTEGTAPRNLALQWFKREMNLSSPVAHEEPRTLLGVTPFHLFTMVLLIAFALAMVAMYFFKMRRAAALFGRLEGGSGRPPPGSSPPLAGAPSPATPAPPADGAPPRGGPPAAQNLPSKPAGGSAPAGESTPAPSTPAAPPAGAPPEGKSPSAPTSPPKPAAGSPAAGAPSPSTPGTPPSGAPAAGQLPASPAKPPAGSAPPAGTPAPSPAPPAGVPPADPPSPPPPVAGAAPPGGPSATPPSTPTSAAVTANWRGQLRIGSIVAETPSVKTFRLRPSRSADLLPFTFVPGQFLNVAFWIGGARMNRSYSISSSPTQRDYVDLTVRREPRGAASRHIDDLLNVGDEIESAGPVGRFTFSGTEADSIVLIAGGVGITPMMSISRYLTELSWPGDIYLFYACRAPTDFIFKNELTDLQRRNSKLHVVVTMSRAEKTDWNGPRGHLTKELLTQTVPNLASRRIHLCGPPALMDSTKAMLAELGVPPEQVKTEAFGATKPTPPPEGTPPKPVAPATGPLVNFSKNNKSAKIHVDQTVLELSEELGIGIEFSCRVGTCGICKVKMTSGEVEMAVQDALEPDDKTKGIILACQAKPKGDVVVEA